MPGTHDKELLFTFEFNRPGLPGLRVIRLTGQEEVSKLFRFDITLVGDTADVDFDAVLNAHATLKIWSRDHSSSAAYQGMVAEFEQEGQVDNYYFYRLTLVPRLWRLNLNRLNEVYLDDKRMPELIEAILARNGLRGPDIQIPAKESSHYRQRSFVCQYEESDLAFISRWMEQEGMYYFFEHEDASAPGEVLQIIDDKKAQPQKTVTLRFTPPENVQTDRQDTCVTAFTCRKTHIPGSVLVQDFNFRKASLGDDLKTEKDVAGGQSGTYMYYGDNLRTEADTEYMSKIRAEALSCRQTLYFGTAPAIGVRSGRYVEITHHFRDTFNGKYWVTRVEHEGSQAGVVLAGQNTAYNAGEQGSVYISRFTAIDAAHQFRPERITPRPIISGVLNAIIDSEGEGDEAELNEYGQYKVQLLYDYSKKDSNKGSSWFRMATPYAGHNNGMHFPLLKGTEVLIAFVGGDPDQPIILSAVPNSETPNVVRNTNAYCNGVRTAGGNVLNLVDKPGKEVVSLVSPKMNSRVYIGTFPSVGADVSLDGGSSSNTPTEILQNAT
jgi:Rhs element Vgr protein